MSISNIYKSDIQEIFGSIYRYAQVVEIDRSACSHWPDPLSTRQACEMMGHAIRLDKPIPDDVMKRFKAQAKAA